MKNIDISKLTKNSWFMFWIITLLFLLFLTNVSAVVWILWYWSDSDYTNPSPSFSWSVNVWTWETLTWATTFTFSQPVLVSSGTISATIPLNTQITNSSWTVFDVTSVSTSVLPALPIAIETNEQDVWKIKFWITWLKLNFSKPVKLQIPVNTTNSTVRILVKHFWVSWYQTSSLTNTITSSCNGSWASIPSSNIASVSNWIATIYTCSASEFVAITDKVISSGSSSGGWSVWTSVWAGGGGGGGSVSLHIDNCPKWDFSKSFYDKSCWTAPVISDNANGTGSAANSTGSNVKNDDTIIKLDNASLEKEIKGLTNSQQRTVNYKWIDIIVIDWYDFSKDTSKISKKIIENKNLSLSEKLSYVNRVNSFLIAKHNLDIIRKKTVTLKNQYIKQYVLLRWILKKLDK